MNVSRDDHPAARHLGANFFRVELFPLRHKMHFFSDDAAPRIMQLRRALISLALFQPFSTHDQLLWSDAVGIDYRPSARKTNATQDAVA